MWCVLWLMALFSIHGGGGVTKQPDITKFWTDDYKVFDQIYGRTSDVDLYGANVPTGHVYGVDAKKYKTSNTFDSGDAAVAGTQIDPFGIDNNFSQLLSNYKMQQYEKPAKVKPSHKLLGQNVYQSFKPVTEEDNPEAFDYFKHLEQLEQQQSLEFPQKGLNGFQPFVDLAFKPTKTESSYKSIQDILEAQEKYREKAQYQEDLKDFKYVNYGAVKSGLKKKPNVRLMANNDLPKNTSRCTYGRCRKRTTNGPRLHNRPVVRRIKHRIVSD